MCLNTVNTASRYILEVGPWEKGVLTLNLPVHKHSDTGGLVLLLEDNCE